MQSTENSSTLPTILKGYWSNLVGNWNPKDPTYCPAKAMKDKGLNQEIYWKGPAVRKKGKQSVPTIKVAD